jgi:tartrate-resistant acid phosphatase type 5
VKFGSTAKWFTTAGVLGVMALGTGQIGACLGRSQQRGAPLPVTHLDEQSLISVETTPAEQPPGQTVFAIIGDFGVHNAHEAAVAKLVASWKPSFIVTTGDDYYQTAGGSGTARYYRPAAAYYGRWMKDVPKHDGKTVGIAPLNAFFPSLGNHDYTDAKPAPKSYLNYFTLPGTGFENSSGNERFYDFVNRGVHFFVLNSNSQEPSGTAWTSAQAQWLEGSMDASAATWNVVIDHNPPYSSDRVHGSSGYMRWPFQPWGADAVVSGHAHVYERVMNHGIPYFVNGLGGQARYQFEPKPVAGSVVRYRSNWGAQKVIETSQTLTFEFWNVNGTLVDRYVVTRQR